MDHTMSFEKALGCVALIHPETTLVINFLIDKRQKEIILYQKTQQELAEMTRKFYELQTKNHELQTKNHELQTKNHELQTKNHELQTKNHELQMKYQSLEQDTNEARKTKQHQLAEISSISQDIRQILATYKTEQLNKIE